MKKSDDLKLPVKLVNAWFAAADNNDVKTLEKCLAAGVPIDLKCKKIQFTALMHAASRARFDAIHTLVAHHADVTLKHDFLGYNALELLLYGFIRDKNKNQKRNLNSVRETYYLLIAYGAENKHIKSILMERLKKAQNQIENHNRQSFLEVLKTLETIVSYKQMLPLVREIALRRDLTPKAIQIRKSISLGWHTYCLRQHLSKNTTSIVYDYLSIKHEINNLVFHSIERPGKKHTKTTSCRLL